MILASSHFQLIHAEDPCSAALIADDSNNKHGKVIYENNAWSLILSAEPAYPGHLLIVPKSAYQDIFQINHLDLEKLDEVLKSIPKLSSQIDFKTYYQEFKEAGHNSAELIAALNSIYLTSKISNFTFVIDESAQSSLQINVIPLFEGDPENEKKKAKAMLKSTGLPLGEQQSDLSALEAANNFYNNPSLALQYFRDIREARGLHPHLRVLAQGTQRKKNTRWLDIGFGPGIEFQHLLKNRYTVDGLDISGPMMVQLQNLLDHEYPTWRNRGQLFNSSMQDFQPKPKHYDRIWSMATFLHLDKGEIAPMINKYGSALKKNGLFYLNFKVGETEERKLDARGRPFVYFTVDSFKEEVQTQVGKHLSLDRIWVPPQKDQLGRSTQWLQIIYRKN